MCLLIKTQCQQRAATAAETDVICHVLEVQVHEGHAVKENIHLQYGKNISHLLLPKSKKVDSLWEFF